MTVTREQWLDLLTEAERHTREEAERYKAQAKAAPPWGETSAFLWGRHEQSLRWADAMRQVMEELAGGGAADCERCGAGGVRIMGGICGTCGDELRERQQAQREA